MNNAVIKDKRPDIQALRAVAVVLVVAFHLRPTLVPGGYVGVDVFFVISGFLIIGHLADRLTNSSTIGLRRFWGRRAGRLLPAALLVLLASTVLTVTVVPEYLRAQFLAEIVASGLYLQNWLLAHNSVDYLTAQNQASIVQHYWSLSVEEQFYIVLPLLIILVLWALHRFDRRRILIGLLVAVTAGSFVYSVVLTPVSSSAYFSTGTRVWEFAAGGLLSFATIQVRRVPAVLLSVAGLCLLMATAAFFSSRTSFPGYWAVVPVVGAVLLLASRGSGLGAVMRLRPIQYLGDISYSVYLWHWPLIIVWPFVVGSPVGWRGVAIIGLLTIVLAALTKRFVEDPVRLWQPARAWTSYALILVATICVLSLAVGSDAIVAANSGAAQAATVTKAAHKHPSCFAAAAVANHCGTQPLVTSPSFAEQDSAPIVENDCAGGTLDAHIGDATECTYGSGTTTVVLVGDSHARQWISALEIVARERGWRIVTLIRSSCPFGDLPSTENGLRDAACITWRAQALSRITALKPAYVFIGSLSAFGYELLNFGLGSPDQQVAGYEAYLTKLVSAGSRVYTFKDGPYLPVAAPECVAGGGKCAYPRSEVLDNHPDALSTATAAVAGVTQINLTRYECPTVCSDVLGGVIVYQDRHHLTSTYSASLAPYLAAAIH